MVGNAFLVMELRRFKRFSRLVAEYERNARVYNRLALDDVDIILRGYVDIGKNGKVRLPADFCSGILFAVRLLL